MMTVVTILVLSICYVLAMVVGYKLRDFVLQQRKPKPTIQLKPVRFKLVFNPYDEQWWWNRYTPDTRQWVWFCMATKDEVTNYEGDILSETEGMKILSERMSFMSGAIPEGEEDNG